MSIDQKKKKRKKKRKWLYTKNGKKQMISRRNYNDIVLLANAPTQAESPLNSLEQTAGSISPSVNVNKTEYMWFNREGTNSTLNGSSLKLVNMFMYIGSSFKSTDVNMHQAKAWTAIDKLSITWKCDLSDKIKRDFFQAAMVSILLYGCTTWTLTKRIEKKLYKNATSYIEQILEVIPLETIAVRPLTSNL